VGLGHRHGSAGRSGAHAEAARCRNAALSSPPSSPDGHNLRSPALTGLPRAGSAGSWPATARAVTQRSSRCPGRRRPPRARPIGPASSSSWSSAASSPDRVGWHLHHHHKITLSRATINRILVRAGLATRDPSQRPITRAWRPAKDGRNPLLSPDSPALWTPRFSCR
jgi:hypothetical protein